MNNLEAVNSMLAQVDEAIEQGTLESFIDTVSNINKTTGITLAKAWYLYNLEWDQKTQGETFLNYASTRFGYKSEIVDRYIKAWQLVTDAPKELTDAFKIKTMKELIPLAVNYANESIELDDETWEEFAKANGEKEVRDKVREMKGKPIRKGSLSIWVDSDGDIHASKDGVIVHVGYLNTNDDDLIVQHAINRIVDRTSIMKH
jgi:hypothetical protein